MRIHFTTTLDAPAGWVVAQLQSTAVFRHITSPLVRFAPVQGHWPTQWAPGELDLHMRLLGVLPMGRQTVRISIESPLDGSPWPVLRDNGSGQLMRLWDHRIHVRDLSGGRTAYTDDIEVQARHLPWLLTPLAAAFAWVFYRHRQRRWRALAAPQARAFERLLRGFDGSAGQPAAQRWLWLEAAHVVGQTAFSPHLRSHWHMLAYARQLGDRREVAGQWLRLALVPLGHLLQRLPIGNTGRATVGAMQPMRPPPAVQALVDQALNGAA